MEEDVGHSCSPAITCIHTHRMDKGNSLQRLVDGREVVNLVPGQLWVSIQEASLGCEHRYLRFLENRVQQDC